VPQLLYLPLGVKWCANAAISIVRSGIKGNNFEGKVSSGMECESYCNNS